MPKFSPDRDRVLCVGESMALVTPIVSEPLRTADRFTIRAGGAESTVALYLADAGVRASWASMLGDDPLGRRILDEIGSHGVDVDEVRVIAGESTGVYFKDPSGETTAVHYYRADSAASRMGPELLESLRLDDVAIIHVSGITAALSASCASLLEATFEAAEREDILISFDVNYREGLWTVAEAAPVLRRLASRADVVFVGYDEAEALWGAHDIDDLSALIAPRGILVVRDGARGATERAIDGHQTFAPSHAVDVVEVVGAGDAFTAGYLGALLRDADPDTRLREGHDTAARALQSTQDFVPRVAESDPATAVMGS